MFISNKSPSQSLLLETNPTFNISDRTKDAHSQVNSILNSMLNNISYSNNCTKRALIISSALYLIIGIGAYSIFNYQGRITKMDIGNNTIALSLEQFADFTKPMINITKKDEPALLSNDNMQDHPQNHDKVAPSLEPLITDSHSTNKELVAKKDKPITHKRHNKRTKDQVKKERPLVNERFSSNQSETLSKKAPAHLVNTELKKNKPSENLLILGRDQHPVLSKIKQAIDSNLIYPRRARMMKEQGYALIQFTYTAQGQIKKLRILKSTGSQELDNAAKQSIIKASSFFPKNNQDFTIRFPIVFKLTD